jgi:DUF438 domain-containing protein
MELIETGNDRVAALIDYLELLSRGPVTPETFARYDAVLSTTTADEANAALHAALAEATDVEAWKQPVARFIRSASVGLDAQTLPAYPEGQLLSRLEAENDAIAAELSELQRLSSAAKNSPQGIEALRARVRGWTNLRDHYVSLQNELFPLFEQAAQAHACVKLMWAIEDDVLGLQRAIAEEKDGGDGKTFWKTFGAFYLTAGSLLYRERRILFPAAFRSVPDRLFSGAPSAGGGAAAFATATGTLSPAELEAIFRVLPFDIAFIGADDRVKFYSDPPHRIFPRSPAVIGRLVQNCHPPKSVATVEEILRSFKSGERDSAEFWLTVKGSFVHIQYYAVRDPEGRYLGTLEATADATRVRALQGEKRLL